MGHARRRCADPPAVEQAVRRIEDSKPFGNDVGIRQETRGDVRAVLAGIILFGLLVNLGFWQLGRASEKTALEARWEARAGADGQPGGSPSKRHRLVPL